MSKTVEVNENGCHDDRCIGGCICPMCGNALGTNKVHCGIWHVGLNHMLSIGQEEVKTVIRKKDQQNEK